MFSHILLATDGSALSQSAVEQGLALAKALGARTTIFHVLPEYGTVCARTGTHGETHDEFLARTKAQAENVLCDLRDGARRTDVACETRYAIDDRPYAAIIHAAEEGGCDLIVMASRVRRGQPDQFGSQTQKVLQHSGIPLLIYR
jgi:nucleotide-binding universal stress UspA family protein